MLLAVGGREARVAQNEASNRDLNELIEAARASSGRYFRILCECGRDDCDSQLAISVDEYERVRQDARWFAVQKDHVIGDVESVTWETDRFAVVQKHEGTAAKVAESRDPRH